MVLQVAIMLGADEGVQVGRADLHLIMHFVEISFSVSNHHHLSLAHHASGLRAHP